MPTNPPAPPFAASWRLLLPVVVGLVVLGSVLLGFFHRQEANKSAMQDAHPVPATPGAAVIEEAKPTSPASSTVATAAQPSAPAILPAAPAAPTNADGQLTQPVAAATPSVPSHPPTAVQDNALIDPLSTEQALDPGESARAKVTVGGVQTPLLAPNQVGVFPRVYLGAGGRADVQVQLPEAQAGEQVVVAVEDGGRFADGQPAQAFTLDGSHRVSFQFQADPSPGNYRVDVRHNAQVKVVAFWVGDRALAVNH